MKRNTGKWVITGHRLWKRFGVLLAALVIGSAFPAWAGQWVQDDNGDYRYEEDGLYAAGWQKIDGTWYYLDTETGVWNPRPTMNGETASYLLSNKLKDAGLYQDEEAEVVCRVDYIMDRTIYLSVGIWTSPNDFSTITSFEVNQRRGTAESKETKIKFNLWE